MRDTVGISVEVERIGNEIVSAVDKLLADEQFSQDSMQRLKEQYLYHVGESGKVGAKYIIERLVKRSGA